MVSPLRSCCSSALVQAIGWVEQLQALEQLRLFNKFSNFLGLILD